MSRAQKRALVVEDEALIAMDTQDALLGMGFGAVEVASSFEAASDALRDERYDLVVFDLNLDGISSAPLVEARREAGEPTLVTSGYDRSAGGRPAGVTVLEKPMRQSALGAAVEGLGL